MRFLPVSLTVLLVELADLDETLALFASLEADAIAGIEDMVPAARTLMIRFRPEVTDARTLATLIARRDLSIKPASSDRMVEVPVRYDGEDLADVATLTGLSIDAVIARHTQSIFTVAFCGFAPGFGYLVGGDPTLQVPRRQTPRTKIAAGSVALGGAFCGVYPQSSPGGWQIIGTTPLKMWDITRDPPALFQPGDRVRFIDLARHSAATPPSIATSALDTSGQEKVEAKANAVTLEVLAAPMPALFQDAGRFGQTGQGVSSSGALDQGAFKAANRVVGNPAGTPCLEITLGGFSFRVNGRAVMALTGAPCPITIRDQAGRTHSAETYQPISLEAGDVVTLGFASCGARSYLALRGGFQVAPVLGSASTDTLAVVGPAPVVLGTILTVLPCRAAFHAVSLTEAPAFTHPSATDVVTLDVIMGPRSDWFTEKGIATLCEQVYTVTPQFNRIGIRLSGAEALERAITAELPSEGTATGAIQVPHSGQPVLFLADHPLTGGYPVIANVAEYHLDLAGQIPVNARIRFRPVTRFAAMDPAAIQDQEDPSMKKVLIANRGEIAVRIIRACRDEGLQSVAVYADPDVDALFVRLADVAYGLDGSRPAETYLDIEKLIAIARRSGADAVHPGYGFLSERAEFARAVQEAGLIWIGPDPHVIEVLGDKVEARRIALSVGAPLVPGSDGPVETAADVISFAQKHGLPVAIKAAHGGGGRGLKVAWAMDEIAELYASAVREATVAFGRGECFVERFLDRPRHIEAQVLADMHGTVRVLGTRDCSLQRRNQKLVEEAPAPFLSDAQRQTIHDAAKRICAAAGYSGAGTVEFLLGVDGTISFLEVNTRLQVEHPVTEETTGIDLVVEQLRVARGEALTTPEPLEPRGHSIEFRINAEDPGRGFLPTPGTITAFTPPSGPGVRLDSGVETGSTVPGTFDSLMAKLIVTGATRQQALARARRALAEFRIEGLASVLPFHRAVLEEQDFIGETGFKVHTRWIETDFADTLEAAARPQSVDEAPLMRTPVEIDGKRHMLGLPASLLTALGGLTQPAADTPHTASKIDTMAILAPIAGTLQAFKIEDGATVQAGDLIAVMEAMKMETPVTAERAGTIRLVAEPGTYLQAGATIARFEG